MKRQLKKTEAFNTLKNQIKKIIFEANKKRKEDCKKKIKKSINKEKVY